MISIYYYKGSEIRKPAILFVFDVLLMERSTYRAYGLNNSDALYTLKPEEYPTYYPDRLLQYQVFEDRNDFMLLLFKKGISEFRLKQIHEKLMPLDLGEEFGLRSFDTLWFDALEI